MKKSLIAMIAVPLLSTSAMADGKFGALAVDRNNGFYFGWSHDYSSQSQANTRALSECNSRGGSCSVVLELSGANRCGAYRTISGDVGTAYGWGKADNKQNANNIALSECLKRSGGEYCGNHVWTCNAATAKKVVKEKRFDMDRLKRLITHHYDHEGMWAGEFKIAYIEKVRLEGQGERFKAHVRYKYEPLPLNDRKAGFDQRVFHVERMGSTFNIIKMDDYMSASF